MQALYPFEFEREMGCTAEELRQWVPGACRDRPLVWRDEGVDIVLDGGRAAIDWRTLPPRRIALITLPRLAVRFAARDVPDAAWQAFMRHFDLYTQRGGG
jgi:hypothetical protein